MVQLCTLNTVLLVYLANFSWQASPDLLSHYCVHLCQSLECAKYVGQQDSLSSCKSSCSNSTTEVACDLENETSCYSECGFPDSLRSSHFVNHHTGELKAYGDRGVVTFQTKDVPKQTLVVLQDSIDGKPWTTITSAFAAEFPVTVEVPKTSCRGTKVAYRALAVGATVLAQPTLISLTPVKQVYEKSFEGKPVIAVFFNLTTDPPSPGRFELPNQVRSDHLVNMVYNCVKDYPTSIFASDALDRKRVKPDQLRIRVPLWLATQNCQSVVIPDIPIHDRLCNSTFRLPQDKVPLNTSCLTLENGVQLNECWESGAFKERLPKCFSKSITTANVTHSNGSVSVDLSWNTNNALNTSLKVDYYRLYYTDFHRDNNMFIKINDSQARSMEQLTTCYQDPTTFEDSSKIDCHNNDQNLTLNDLMPDREYMVIVCAVFMASTATEKHMNAAKQSLSRLGHTFSTSKKDIVTIPPNGAWILSPILVTLAAILALIIILAVLLVRRFRNKQKILTKKVQELEEETNNNYYSVAPHDLWECARSNIKIYDDVILGKGAFGVVHKGKLLAKARAHKEARSMFAAIRNRFENCEVAVKRLPDYATERDKEKFLVEIQLMKRLAQDLGFHEHIVNPLACITKSVPYCLIMEYCSDGNLLDFMRERRVYMTKLDESGIDYQNPEPDPRIVPSMLMSMRMMVQFAVNITYAMEHISTHGYIHRDLAARNILVDKSKTSQTYFAKVADFGMARRVNEADPQYLDLAGNKVPIKWMAIESLQKGEYATKTDVWSFGVLLFEIMSLGGGPYANINPHDVLEYLNLGHRIKKPDSCDDDIYQLMLDCWAADPTNRPTFAQLREKISRKYEQFTASYNYIPAIDPAADYYQSGYPMVRRELPPAVESNFVNLSQTGMEKTSDKSLIVPSCVSRVDSGIDEEVYEV